MFYIQDVYDRNITIYFGPNMHIWKEIMLKMPHPYPELAERMTIHDSWEMFDLDTEKVFEKESMKITQKKYYDCDNFYKFREHMLSSLTLTLFVYLLLNLKALSGTDQRIQSLLVMDFWVVDL